MGYRACMNTGTIPLAEGSVGAGTGCTVGKILGQSYAMKGGIGACAFRQDKLLVGAIIAVNCVGDIYDRESGRIIAGVLRKRSSLPGNTEDIILSDYKSMTDFFSGNTVTG